MNLTLLDRDQLEAILLNPSSEAAQPLVCSDNAVVAYLPVPATARDERLRHVLAAAHELRFYSKVFGWSDEPKDLGPMGTYHVQMLGDKQVGGLMKNPMPGAPTGTGQ